MLAALVGLVALIASSHLATGMVWAGLNCESEVCSTVHAKGVSVAYPTEYEYSNRPSGRIFCLILPLELNRMISLWGERDASGYLSTSLVNFRSELRHDLCSSDTRYSIGGGLAEILNPKMELLRDMWRGFTEHDRVISGRYTDISPQLSASSGALFPSNKAKAHRNDGEQQCGNGGNGVAVFNDKDGGTFTVDCDRIADTEDSLWRMLLAVCGIAVVWGIYTRIKGAR
jgi:hypothetical protein